MKQTEPSLKDWKALYETAARFRKIEPWKFMKETDIFGVLDPHTGETGYCCIMGELGELLAIAVYNGTEGLQSYQKIQKGLIQPGDPEVIYMQSCLMLTFENRQSVQEEDREIIKELGLRFRGKNAWPVFRSYRPGFFPWFLDRAEVLFMTIALEQAIGVCLRILQGDPIDFSPKRNRFLVRKAEEKNGAFFWSDAWMEPSPPREKARSGKAPLDEIRIQRLKKTAEPVTAVWEADFFHIPTPVLQGERPVFPYAIILMDHDTGSILDLHIAGGKDYEKEFVERLLSYIEQTSSLPLEILVRKEEVAEVFEQCTAHLNIKLSKVRRLLNIEHAQRDLEENL